MVNSKKEETEQENIEDIFEKIGLTVEEADECHDCNYVNELCGFTPVDVVLKEIISDNRLSVEKKVYITWLYAYTLDKRKECGDIQQRAW